MLAFLSVVILRANHSMAATPPRCEGIYNQARDSSRTTLSILKQHIEDLANSGGFPMQQSTNDPIVKIQVSETTFPMSNWVVQKIKTSDGGSYFGLDVGFENFAKDQEKLGQLYLNHLAGPNYNLPFSIEQIGNRKSSVDELKKWRWSFHEAVIQSYASHPHKKKYLDLGELSSLSFQNNLAEHSDVFGIVLDPGKPLSQMTKNEIKANTVVTVQLTYASHSYAVLTDLDYTKVIRNIREKNPAKNLWLPFMDRMQYPSLENSNSPNTAMAPMPQIDISDFKFKFQSEFGNKKVAEINRWSKPMTSASDSLRDLSLLMLLNRAEERGVEFLFASSDKATRRLFTRQYFFKDYHTILRPIFNKQGQTTGNFAEEEFVLFLQIGTPEYLELKQKLKASAAKESVINQIPFMPSP